jgi:hypothetical protein
MYSLFVFMMVSQPKHAYYFLVAPSKNGRRSVRNEAINYFKGK